jgi:hypothetical protein
MALPDLPGYQRIPGDKARRVRTPEGGEISRRHYEDLRFRRAGYRNWREFQDIGASPAYNRFLTRAVRETKEPRTALRRVESDFNALYLEAMREGMGDEKPGEYKRAFRDFLVYLGWRKESDDYPIGATPKKRGRG